MRYGWIQITQECNYYRKNSKCKNDLKESGSKVTILISNKRRITLKFREKKWILLFDV